MPVHDVSPPVSFADTLPQELGEGSDPRRTAALPSPASNPSPAGGRRAHPPCRIASAVQVLQRRQRREAPLVEFTNARDFQKWLVGKPREVAVALAARSALRVLPRVWMTRDASMREDFGTVILSVFHATSITWFAAAYPDQAAKVRGLGVPAAEAAFTAAQSPRRRQSRPGRRLRNSLQRYLQYP